MAKHRDEPHLKRRDADEGNVDNCYGEEEEEEEAEEALSFSDLPLELEQDALLPQEDEENCCDRSHSDSQLEFEFGIGFGSWLGSMSTQPLPEMCAADDLFFQGRILPLRRDDSADRSFTKKSTDETNSFTKGLASRSDSVESSRSSSKGSQRSSSGSTTSTSTSFGSSRVAYSSASNQFSSCRSPGPQTGFPGSNKPILLQANKIRGKSQTNSSSSASIWEFFRTGLVRTPDIELHNLKTRANDNNNSCDNNNKVEQEKGKKKKKGIGLGILGGCKCTGDSVVTNLVLLRSDSSRIRNRRKSNAGSGEEEELRRKLMELIEIDDSRSRKTKKKEEATVEKSRDRLTSSWSRRRRTFEWVKELPHAAAGGYYVLHQYQS